MPKQTSSRTAITSAISGLVLGAALLTLPIAAVAGSVVTLWHTEPNPKTVGVMKEIIADYEKLNPGVKVNQEPIPWGDLDQKMQAALAAGAPPDASHGQAYVERSLSAKGLLLPIDEVVESIGADDIWDVVKKLNYHDVGQGNHYYGLAHAIGTDVHIIRKDYYRKAGISVTEPPKTWDEWLAQLKKLTVDTNGDGKTDVYGLGLAGPGFFINEEVYMWAGSNGGRLFDPNGRPTFTEKPIIEMLEFFKEVSDCCLAPDWLSHGYLDTFAMLATGKVASILGWGRGTGYFEKYAADVVANGDIGVMPGKPVGPSGKAFLTQLDCEPWMVFKDGKNPQGAIDFLKFFYQPDNYRKYIQTVPIHFFPILKSVQQDPKYLATPDLATWKFWVDAQKNIIANHDPKPLMITEWDDLNLPFVQEVAGSGILVEMVTDVVEGRLSAADAAAKAQKRTEKLITQLGYKKW